MVLFVVEIVHAWAPFAFIYVELLPTGQLQSESSCLAQRHEMLRESVFDRCCILVRLLWRSGRLFEMDNTPVDRDCR